MAASVTRDRGALLAQHGGAHQHARPQGKSGIVQRGLHLQCPAVDIDDGIDRGDVASKVWPGTASAVRLTFWPTESAVK
jgi:hypothetical protein